MIPKPTILMGFAARLKDAMLAAGHPSTHAKSGVCIRALTNLTGYSRQICRKYLEGAVIPEPHVLLKLAQDLKVSAGWLLFGEIPREGFSATRQVLISKNLLHYILSKQVHNPDWLIRVIQEISQMSGNEQQLKQIIDLALAQTTSPLPVPQD